jgi:hypothetical protein
MKFSFQFLFKFSFSICITKRLSSPLAIMRRHFLSFPHEIARHCYYRCLFLRIQNRNQMLANDNPSVPICISVFCHRTINSLPENTRGPAYFSRRRVFSYWTNFNVPSCKSWNRTKSWPMIIIWSRIHIFKFLFYNQNFCGHPRINQHIESMRAPFIYAFLTPHNHRTLLYYS